MYNFIVTVVMLLASYGGCQAVYDYTNYGAQAGGYGYDLAEPAPAAFDWHSLGECAIWAVLHYWFTVDSFAVLDVASTLL